MSYYVKERVGADFETAVERTREALREEGLGVLTDVDMRAAAREELGVEEFPEYRILGACTPDLAREAAEGEPDLGTLLPCNVVVYEDADGETFVSAVAPHSLLGLAENLELDAAAGDLADRLEGVVRRASGDGAADADRA